MSEAHRATEKTDPALSPDQEIEAMRRIAAGEHEAYAMVTALYMTDIYRYACGLLRDQAAAEDVTQENPPSLMAPRLAMEADRTDPELATADRA